MYFCCSNYDDLVTPKERCLLKDPLIGFLAKKDICFDEFNNNLFKYIRSDGYCTRDCAIKVATYITNHLEEEFNIRLPYTYNGGHNNKSLSQYNGQFNEKKDYGFNPNWGMPFPVPYLATNNEQYKYYGLDCSGLISWILYNAGYRKINRSSNGLMNGHSKFGIQIYKPLGECYRLEEYLPLPGDLIASPKHVMFIIHVDQTKGYYYAVEAKDRDQGVIINKYSFDYLNNMQLKYSVINMDQFYNGERNKIKNLTLY